MNELDVLKKRIRNQNKNTEPGIKKVSRTGKDKSLLRLACKLGFICNEHPIIKDGRRYVNPHTIGDKIYLEGINPIEYVEYKDYEFYDLNNKVVAIGID
jgi:hypothetical protein